MAQRVPPRVVPSRDEYYMGLTFWIASKSKDPNTQCGSIIISKDNFILSTGYNGPPAAIPDDEISWSRDRDSEFNKYTWVKHSEDNAIDHAPCWPLPDTTLYVTGFPCNDCMRDIVSAKISKVVYFPKKLSDAASMTSDESIFRKTKEIARMGRVLLVEFKGNLNWMRDRIAWMESKGVFD